MSGIRERDVDSAPIGDWWLLLLPVGGLLLMLVVVAFVAVKAMT